MVSGHKKRRKSALLWQVTRVRNEPEKEDPARLEDKKVEGPVVINRDILRIPKFKVRQCA